jgi:hypothetical protein
MGSLWLETVTDAQSQEAQTKKQMRTGRLISTFVIVYLLLGVMTASLMVIDALRDKEFQKRLDGYYEHYREQGCSHLRAEFMVCRLIVFGVCYTFIFWIEVWVEWIQESYFDE